MIEAVKNPNGFTHYRNPNIPGNRFTKDNRWGEVWPKEDGYADAIMVGTMHRDARVEYPSAAEAEAAVRRWIIEGVR